MPESPDRPRLTWLVALLAFTSGCVDVVTLTAVGGTFTSVITGNLIIVGQAIGTSSLSLALHVIMAVAGYIAGVAAGSRLRQAVARRAAPAAGHAAASDQATVSSHAAEAGRAAPATGRPAPASSRPAPEVAWPWPATLVLAAEWATLAAVNVAWIGYAGAPPGAAADVLLTAAAVALGLQGAAARAIKGNPSTTYMTGTLTALVEALSTGRRRDADVPAALGLIALVAGAAGSAVLVRHARPAALLPPLASLGLVIIIKLRQHRAERVTP